MTEHPVEAHYRKKRKDAPADPDFAALDQGRASSLRRYELVSRLVRAMDGRLLDLGCGTAAILDTLNGLGKLPLRYTGVDGFMPNEEAVMRRFRQYQLAGWFEWKPMEQPFEALIRGGFDAAVCIGVAGFWGLHTNRQLTSLQEYMAACARYGCIVIPQAYMHNQLGDLHIRRWPTQDIRQLFPASTCKVFETDREIFLYW